jgi:hypothetical protein
MWDDADCSTFRCIPGCRGRRVKGTRPEGLGRVVGIERRRMRSMGLAEEYGGKRRREEGRWKKVEGKRTGYTTTTTARASYEPKSALRTAQQADRSICEYSMLAWIRYVALGFIDVLWCRVMEKPPCNKCSNLVLNGVNFLDSIRRAPGQLTRHTTCTIPCLSISSPVLTRPSHPIMGSAVAVEADKTSQHAPSRLISMTSMNFLLLHPRHQSIHLNAL